MNCSGVFIYSHVRTETNGGHVFCPKSSGPEEAILIRPLTQDVNIS